MPADADAVTRLRAHTLRALGVDPDAGPDAGAGWRAQRRTELVEQLAGGRCAAFVLDAPAAPAARRPAGSTSRSASASRASPGSYGSPPPPASTPPAELLTGTPGRDLRPGPRGWPPRASG